MKNIVIAIPNLYAGTGTFCRFLSKGVKKYYSEKYRISLVLLEDKGLKPDDKDYFDEIHILGMPAHKGLRQFYEVFIHASYLNKKLRQISPDVVLSCGTYMNILLSYIVDKQILIISEHDTPSLRLANAKYGLLIFYLIRITYKYNKIIIGISKGVVKDLKSKFDLKIAKLIYYGVDIEDIETKANLPISENFSSPYIVSVGRLSSQKDYTTLINSFNLCVKNGIKENLLIIGEGEERDTLQNLAKGLGISDRVHFLGYRQNPYPYIKKAKFFVLSSRWEGFGLVLAEAMTLSKPCISTDCPSGPGEIIKDKICGYTVPPGDEKTFSRAIMDLATDENKIAVFSKESRVRVEEFSLKKMTNSYIELFEGVISGSK